MLNPIIDSLVALLNSVIGYEMGTNEYYIVLGATLFAMCVSARIFVGLFGSERGIVLTSLGVLLPVLIGGIGYALSEIYLVPLAEAEWATNYAPWMVFGLMTILATSLLTKHFFNLNRFMSLFTVLLSLGAGVAAIVCSGLIVDVINSSSSSLEQREERVTDELESIHR